MYGYWNASAPIKIADGHEVLATSWVRHDTPDVLVAIGSWNAGKCDMMECAESAPLTEMGLGRDGESDGDRHHHRFCCDGS